MQEFTQDEINNFIGVLNDIKAHNTNNKLVNKLIDKLLVIAKKLK